jgi:hypothetical protein
MTIRLMAERELGPERHDTAEDGNAEAHRSCAQRFAGSAENDEEHAAVETMRNHAARG